MKKRALVAIATLFTFITTVKADPVTPQRAATVATNFMSAQTGKKVSVELTRHTEDWHYAGIYLFERKGGGWVIVAADDCVKPILGYSTSGRLDPSDLPPALRQWLGGYEEQIAAVRMAREEKATIAVYASDTAEWRRLERCDIEHASTSKESDGVGPLITSHWNQQYPYDRLCPSGTVTGCAATALAMYMKFWNYPAFGCGSYSYNPPRTGTTESADFGHTLYDWANMPDSSWQYDTPEEVMAVATLMYHCGVGMSMDYGTAESGGSSALGIVGQSGYSSMDNAMKDYFHYSPNMRACFKNYGYTNDSWRALLVAELDEGRPILYSGAATQGGHGFICDGYDSRQYMHFNFGWSGTGDGYYPVDSISPGVGGVGGNVTYTFNMQNACLVGAVPDYALRSSDSLFTFMAGGGTDSLLVGINEQNNATLDIATTAEWLNLEHGSIGRAGWVRLEVAPMSYSGERVAYIVFTQGEERDSVKVVQVAFDEEEMCELTVVMENTNSHFTGWDEGAYLTLESSGGFVFGTAHLENADRDSVTIRVAPKDIHCVWHSGGGTDRYVNYWVRNQYGEDFVSVVNAYRNGGNHIIPWSCAHLGIEERPIADRQVTIYPNPAHNTLNIQAEGVQQVEIIDMSGRKIQCVNVEPNQGGRSTGTMTHIQIGSLPPGHYFARIITTTGNAIRRFVKK